MRTEERAEVILERIKQRYTNIADQYRDRLIELYGDEKGSSITYAGAFELSEYGSGATIENPKRLFPGFNPGYVVYSALIRTYS